MFDIACSEKSLMAQWFGEQLRDVKCTIHDPQVMGSNLWVSWVRLRKYGTSV